MIPGPARLTGTVASWNDERGFGFVAPERGGGTIFVHISGYRDDARRPVVGDVVDFELRPADRGRRQAGDVVLVRASPAAPARAATRSRRRRGLVASDVVALAAVVAFAALAVVVHLAWGPLPVFVPVLYLGASLASFLAYAGDKRAAVSGGWRISESSLIALGIVGGWPGGILAQRIFRHKTRKTSFIVSFWSGVLLNVVAFVLLSSPLAAEALRTLLGA
jgi:uncharacterized membrane protein YsdA (DUF1294 family)/cold shock CspA family protein